MKLNLSERGWVGELGALVPEGKTRANNLTDHKKDKEQLEEKG